MPTLKNDHGSHPLDVAIGQRIRERRRALGQSQQDLAEQLRVSFQQVQKYERGANRVSFSRLVEIAAALRCSVADLADGLNAEAKGAVQQINRLTEVDGALELLEAFARLPNDRTRRALVEHARSLSRVLA